MYTYPYASQPALEPNSGKTTAFAVMSTVLLGTGSLYEMDRADDWKHHVQPRVEFIFDTEALQNETLERPDVRTAAEHIENIRNILNPPVSDLAAIFDVSRQAIYKWISGDSSPEGEKFSRIIELSQIADKFKEENISRAETLLKIKTFQGRSLMELIKTGENRSEHITALISEARAMESSYKKSGLADSKASPTNDWQSSISIPGSSERD